MKLLLDKFTRLDVLDDVLHLSLFKFWVLTKLTPYLYWNVYSELMEILLTSGKLYYQFYNSLVLVIYL